VAAPVTSRTVSLEVNGEQIEYEVPTRRLLVHFLRDDLGLTGTRITTVEGLAADGELTALQQAFNEHHALQCGYCTPGMLMSATALLAQNPHPSEDEVRYALQGNICRCTGYVNIVEAVVAAGAAK
jgi:aerobic carbon-monoxide dehydrogenase small subunit